MSETRIRERPALRAIVLVTLAVAAAHAQNEPDVLGLAQIHDDKQLAEALGAITQDPAIHADDDSTRPLAQALLTEGVHQLRAGAHDQALANFLQAYEKLPSPKILLAVGAVLRDMGRLDDAANTYQRYLADPATTDHVGEIKALLLQLDQQLTILTVRVSPRGSAISLDGGPFVVVGSSLLTRVRPGLHLVRIRNGDQASEATLNGFEGETKEISASLAMVDTGTPATTNVTEHVEGWLITGTRYGVSADASTDRARRVRTGSAGAEVQPIVPHYQPSDAAEANVRSADEGHAASGILGFMRIDAAGRCCAGGLGVAIAASEHFELDAAALRSDEWGAYLGARYRFLTGMVRPYATAGFPIFLYSDSTMNTQIAPGVRVGAGIEVVIDRHVSALGDFGVEHFFNVEGAQFDATVYVPTLGVIGRL